MMKSIANSIDQAKGLAAGSRKRQVEECGSMAKPDRGMNAMPMVAQLVELSF
jgi:hypothetical protein